MWSKRVLGYALLLLVVGLLAGACSSSDSTDTTMSGNMDTSDAHTYSFGEPAMAAEATRVIDI